MALPQITSISPRRGHSGGRTLVEIVGSGFRLPDDPPLDVAPVPASPPSVRVFFGATEATNVQVWDQDLIYCQTPILDPGRDVQSFTADILTNVLTAVGHGMIEGEQVSLNNTGGALPAPLRIKDVDKNLVPYWLVNVTTNTFQLALMPGGAPIDLTDDGPGTHYVDADAKVDVRVENVELAHAFVECDAEGPFDLDNGDTLLVKIDGGAQTIVFVTAQFLDINAATAAEVAAAINAQVVGASASVVEVGRVRLRSDLAGAESRVQVTGGTANAPLDFTTEEQTGSDSELEQVGGEEATFVKAYAPIRPNLSQEGHLATVIGQFLLELRRQVVQNVSFTTHTDFDDATGDMLNIAQLSELPALLVVGLSTPENRSHAAGMLEDEQNINDPTGPDGDFITLAMADFVDVVGVVVAVTDDDIQLFNLIQVVKRFFRKNPKLAVPREHGNPAAGVIEYDLEGSINSQLAVTAVGGNTNVQFSAYDFRIEGVRLEDMPGLPTQGISKMPVGVPAEAVIGVGKTAETVEVVTTTTTQSGTA